MKKAITKSIFCVIFAVSVAGLSAQEEKSALQYYESGVMAQNSEDWYFASQQFLEAVKKNPVYSDAWYNLAECSYQLGEFELTLTQLEEAEKYAKSDIKINNLRGMTFIALERFSDARSIFESILENSPNNVEARFGLAELDLFDGRITGAEKQYLEALKRQGTNRKALLSLAVVSAQLNKPDMAKYYIGQAVSNYSGEAEVHYLSAIVSAMKGDLKACEKQCRVALEINGNYDKAYELLSKTLFELKQYKEVVSICDYRIARNRESASSWYLKGASLLNLKQKGEAIEAWSTGLRIIPTDETMRAALEIEVNNSVSIEDSRRKEWALYHVLQAREALRRFDKPAAIYEYQRALKLEPDNEEARLCYADMLELNGLHELYLEQLLFVRANREQAEQVKKTRSQVQMDDTIEAYDNILSDSLSKKWNVQPFYLDKVRWNLGLYYVNFSVNQLHVQANKVASEFAGDIFAGIASAAVQTQSVPVSGFGDAYQKARSSKKDYFIILSVDEGERDISLSYEMYSARTGYKICENTIYGTGNLRYANVFRRFRSEILEKLPVRGKIIDREGKIVLCDLGRSENIVEGSVFDIVKKGSVETSSTGSGITYRDDDILGTFTVTKAGEEISEGLMEYDGFYDRVNTGDELILIGLPKNDEENALNPGEEYTGENAVDNVPMADASGNSLRRKKPGLTAQDLGIRRTPGFIELIRSIY